MKKLTLVIVQDDNRILLGMKKRGFGKGKWNGFGGKVEEGETIEQAAIREMHEECGVHLDSPVSRGILRFFFEGESDDLEVHLFHADAYIGKPRETEEMRPQWFVLKDIPFHKMWADDRHWLPLILKGKSVDGHFWFKGEEIVKYRLETLVKV